MSTIRFIVKLSFFILLLSGCDITGTVDYELDYSASRIVITGFIGLGNQAEVYISTTHQPLTHEIDTIKNAEIQLFENDKYVANLRRNNESIFVTEGFHPEAGKEYSLKVLLADYPNVNSESESIPPPVQIDSIKYFINTDKQLFLSLYFKDPPGDNFYSLRVIRSYNDTLVSKADQRSRLFSPEVFNDKLFDSQIYRQEKTLSLGAGRYQGKNIYYNNVLLILYSISESGYRFYKSLDEADFTYGDMFTSPSTIYSNINNGCGVFSAYSTDSVNLKLVP